jgi:putative nucleotidyltransferase with HDIG domain
MKGTLVVLCGRSAGQSYVVEQGKSLIAGRGETSEIPLAEVGVSRRHFSLEIKGSFFVLTDLGSSNGTFVNEKPVKKYVLKNGDRIRAGAIEMQFHLTSVGDEVEAPLPPGRLDETKITKRIEEDHIGKDLRLEAEADSKRSQEMLRTLYKVGNIINAESDREMIFETIIDCVLDVFEANRGFLLLYDAEKDRFERVAVRTGEGREAELNPSRTILTESVQKGMSILSTDTLKDSRFKAGESIVLHNIRSAMCVPLESKRRILGALYVDNLSVKGAFTEFDLEVLSAIGKQAGIAIEKLQLQEENAKLFFSTIRTLVATIEAKDHYTAGHTERVASYALQIARELDFSNEDLEDLKLGGLLHDVGKIGIPEKILKKPGKLTAEEFGVMKGHPAIGAKIAGNIENIDRVREIVLHHHEKWDGTGYPGGLKGERIPLGARVLAAADAYDAMTSHRTYRRDFSPEEVVTEFKRVSGFQFDPQVVEAFFQASEKGNLVPPEILSVEEILPKPDAD